MPTSKNILVSSSIVVKCCGPLKFEVRNWVKFRSFLQSLWISRVDIPRTSPKAFTQHVSCGSGIQSPATWVCQPVVRVTGFPGGDGPGNDARWCSGVVVSVGDTHTHMDFFHFQTKAWTVMVSNTGKGSPVESRSNQAHHPAILAIESDVRDKIKKGPIFWEKKISPSLHSYGDDRADNSFGVCTLTHALALNKPALNELTCCAAAPIRGWSLSFRSWKNARKQ